MVTRACPSCGEVAGDGSLFCERCGASLSAAPAVPAAAAAVAAPAVPHVKVAELEEEPPLDPAACRACGGVVAADGYCEECGAPAVSERDHWLERPSDRVAGVCDRGVRHARNEDAMALSADGPVAVLVVCDGVSSAPDSDVASLAAARAARDVLAAGPDPAAGDGTARVSAWSALLVRAAASADAAITEAVGDLAGRAEPPSCTFVAAVVEGPTVVAGWLGDSRVYWVPDDGPALQLSVDDSGASDLMAQGVPRARAEASPQAHAITRWLGPDSEGIVPRTAPTRTQGAGWVLACSDGLWNYCSEATDMGALLHRTAADVGGAPDAIAAELVRWANAQGGRDNITAALARVEPPFDSLQASTPPVAADTDR